MHMEHLSIYLWDFIKETSLQFYSKLEKGKLINKKKRSSREK